MKVHGAIDADTLAILSWELTTPNVHDTLVLPALLDGIRVPITDVFADAGYLSSKNAQLIVARGATPFIRPKKNTRGRPTPGEKDSPAKKTSEEFRTMVDSYNATRETWIKKYGKRNTIESTWSAIKRRFGHTVGSSSQRMQRVEAALRLVAWNLTRVTRKWDF